MDETNVYWIDASSVNMVPVNGGKITTLASGLNSPVGLAIGGGSAIWTEFVCCAHGQKGSVKKVPIAGGPVTVLVDGADGPGAVDVDASTVYWAEGDSIEGSGRIAKVPIGGGAVTTVAGGVFSDLAPIAADDTSVYIADDFTIKKVPIAGGPVEKLAAADFYVAAIATDGVSVYWNEDPFSTVRKGPVSGGPVVTLAPGFGPAGPIAVDHTHVYWMDHFDTIKKVPIGGGAVVTLASNLPFLDDLVADGTNVFFSEHDTGRIRTMSVEGGAISTLVTESPFASPSILAVDNVNLYWINQANVGSVPKAGGSPTFIKPGGLASDPFTPNAIATDGSRVFWTEVAGGTIWKATLGAETPPPVLVAAVLPSSRSVQVGSPATAFAAIINLGPGTATGCSIAPGATVPVAFTYQTTDPSTNALTGTLNTPVDIPSGQMQTFVFAFTPTSPFAPTDVQLTFACTNADAALVLSGLNTLLLSASATPVPDIVALAATAGNTGIVTLASVGAFAVATVNVGAGALITVAADTGAVSLPVSLALCQTAPTTGACLAPPTPTVTTQIDANATPTFGVFVTGSGPVPFAPATNRIFVRFTDSGGVVRGATSVAVRTQ